MVVAPGTPTDVARKFFRAVDQDDVDTVSALSAGLVEFCDEISGGWARFDREGVRRYSEAMANLITDSRTEIHAAHERILDDVATVTGTVRQSYSLNGEPRHYEILVSMVFHRGEAGWELTIGHMTPTETSRA